MSSNSDIEVLKRNIREDILPYFSDEELESILSEKGNLKDASYYCLILKSEDTTLSVSGLDLKDTSSYFRRLASLYRGSNSKNL